MSEPVIPAGVYYSKQLASERGIELSAQYIEDDKTWFAVVEMVVDEDGGDTEDEVAIFSSEEDADDFLRHKTGGYLDEELAPYNWYWALEK